MEREYAKVCLTDDIPYSLDREYDYYVPAELRPGISRGAFVTVPFGKGNRRRLALVTDFAETPSAGGKIKPIDTICPDSMSLDDELLGLCRYLKEQTLCTMGDAVHSIIPAAAMSRLIEFYRPACETSAAPESGRDAEVCGYIFQRKKVTEENLVSKFGKTAQASVKRLMDAGLVARGIDIKEGGREIFRELCSLAINREDAGAAIEAKPGTGLLRSDTQRKIVAELLSVNELSFEEIIEKTGATRQQIRTLSDRKILAVRRETAYREPFTSGINPITNDTDYILTPEQEEAYSTLVSLSRSGEARAALLHGVTGSGKTCVMVKIIDEVLASGRSAILLLPEISLTPQSVGIFCSRYGCRVALIHSGLSAGERLDAYNKIKRGEADLVIGTRSAIFSPVKNLGLVIIDEEQEHTYKSDADPKYHARDVARWRCAKNKALLLLASATPSVESYQKAVEGKYTLLKLTGRYGGTPLPSVTVADMRSEAEAGNIDPVGSILSEELKKTISEGKQAVLFLNRRGYNNFVSCRICGAAVKCPRCSVAMNYHVGAGNYDDGELVCHWCGHRQKQPAACPECGSPHLIRMGFGTQRLERDLSELLPGARILRMDADSTSTKSAYDDLLGKFRRHEADILLGTQMVTKGHDFPDVALAGVLLADASLYLDDYRANERTFALLAQVIGRAGRRESPGRAVIQTNNPDNDVIKQAVAQDYESFFANEIRLRRLLVFPPFCDIVLMTLNSTDEKELLIGTEKLSSRLRQLLGEEYSDVPNVLFGPFEAPVYRVDNKYRMRMVMKCRLNKRSRALFSQLLTEFTGSPHVPSLCIDFNPSSL